jgi:hypothetical protein
VGDASVEQSSLMQAILLLFSLACVAAASIVGDPRKLTSASAAAAVPSAADSMTGAVKGVQVGYTLSGRGWSSCKVRVLSRLSMPA